VVSWVIDIIVPVLNDVRIFRCIESVKNFDNSENARLLIMAGHSSQDFIDEVRGALRPHDLIFRERDHGIFDALNQGLEKSTAPIIGWLGADDIFSAKIKSSEVVNEFSSGINVLVYSSAYHKNGIITRCLDARKSKPSLRKWGYHNPHFSTFLARNLATAHKFQVNLDRPSEPSDIEYFLNVLQGAKLKLIPTIGTYMEEGGAGSGSVSQMFSNLLGRSRIYREKYGVFFGIVSPVVCTVWKIMGIIKSKIHHRSFSAEVELRSGAQT